jgi:hypothetical protein
MTTVFDNGGETLDRYTIYTPDGSVYGMSEHGLGFDMYIGDVSEIPMGDHLGKRLDEIPAGILDRVTNRINQ